MRRFFLSACACALAAVQPMRAQAPVPQTEAAAPARPAESTKLPVRRVILYKNGIGYFEHLGKVRGSQAVAIDFNSSQLNDVLKSLTALDLGNGRITDISYNSTAPLAQRLGALRLPLGEQTTLAQVLGALRGAKLEVHSAERSVTGRLLSVERRVRGRGEDAGPRDEITLVTDGGEVQSIELSPSVRVKLAEHDSADQISRYLGLLASARAEDQRRMVISTSGTGERDLLVSYVSEVPIWKTTYRIVLPSAAGGKTLLQGWAIVDNTVGEDWNDVQLSLVAGAPQSFIQQISQPIYAQRPVVALPSAVLVAPQTHQATLTNGIGSIHGKIQDASGASVPGAEVRVLDEKGAMVRNAVSGSDGEYRIRGVPAGSYRLQFVLQGFETSTMDADVEGGGDTEQDATLRVGAVTETVNVTGGESSSVMTQNASMARSSGGVGGFLSPAAPPPAIDEYKVAARLAAVEASAQGMELGDLFEYRIRERVTIRKNQSALVPIVATEVGAQRVSLWNDQTGARPLRSLWLTNSSGFTLDGGSFTVLEDSAFAGEGLVEPLKPNEKRLLSYAVDLGVQVSTRQGEQQLHIQRIRITHGVAVTQSEQRTERVYTIRNNDNAARTVVIEHPIRPGWTLAANLQPAETSASAYRFLVPIDAKKNATLDVVEVHPLEARYEIAQLDDSRLAVFIRGASENKALAQALAPILAKKAAIAALAAELNARQAEIARIGQDQGRVRENMKSLKGTPEEQQLVRRYVTQLNAEEDRLVILRREAADLDRRRDTAAAELAQMLEALTLDVDVTK